MLRRRKKIARFKLNMLSETKTKRRPLFELTAYSWKYLGRTCVSASCLATPMTHIEPQIWPICAVKICERQSSLSSRDDRWLTSVISTRLFSVLHHFIAFSYTSCNSDQIAPIFSSTPAIRSHFGRVSKFYAPQLNAKWFIYCGL